MKKRNFKRLSIMLMTLVTITFTSCTKQIEQDAKNLARLTCQTNYLYGESQETNPDYLETGEASAKKYEILIAELDSIKLVYEKLYSDTKSKEEFEKLVEKYSQDCDVYINELTAHENNKEESSETVNSNSVESSVLFEGLNSDLAVVNQKYANKRIVIKNLLLCGGFVNDNNKRRIICIPIDVKTNKMGVLERDVASYFDNFKVNESTPFFTEFKEGRTTIYGMSVYYLGNKKLENMYETDRDKFCAFKFELRDPSDYKKFRFPKLVKLGDPNSLDYPSWIASFTEVVDIEANVTLIDGGNSNTSYMELVDAIIVKQTPYLFNNDINAVTSEINLMLSNKKKVQDVNQKEIDLVNDTKTIAGKWKGVVEGRNLIIDIGVDNMDQIYGSSTYDGEYSPISGSVDGKSLQIYFSNSNHVVEVSYADLNYNTELVGYITKRDRGDEIEGERKNIKLKRH